MRFRSLCLLAILSLLLPVFESSVFGQQEESEVPESPEVIGVPLLGGIMTSAQG